jgi:hypothetical protein
MKTIAPAAMAAIEAGEAIVSGAVVHQQHQLGDLFMRTGRGAVGHAARRSRDRI